MTSEQHRIADLTDPELLAEWRKCRPGQLNEDWLAAELEKRNLDT